MQKKLLIIEDDPDILEVLEMVFSTYEFDVVTSSRSLSADMVSSLLPDIVLLDYWLSNGLGSDLCKAIKADPFLSHVPIIMLSAYLQLPEVANDSCADGFVKKPFDIDELYKYVKGVAFAERTPSKNESRHTNKL